MNTNLEEYQLIAGQMRLLSHQIGEMKHDDANQQALRDAMSAFWPTYKRLLTAQRSN